MRRLDFFHCPFARRRFRPIVPHALQSPRQRFGRRHGGAHDRGSLERDRLMGGDHVDCSIAGTRIAAESRALGAELEDSEPLQRDDPLGPQRRFDLTQHVVEQISSLHAIQLRRRFADRVYEIGADESPLRTSASRGAFSHGRPRRRAANSPPPPLAPARSRFFAPPTDTTSRSSRRLESGRRR